MICEAGDVVVVPFPFSDMPVAKTRPAVVISPFSTNELEGETLLAMVTTAATSGRPGDTRLVDLAEAGLKVSCVVRLKVFTLDNRLVARRIGALSQGDRKSVRAAIQTVIAI
jgi:mRNA interferase MazF